MASPALPDGLRLESLEVGAAPLVRLLLDRLDLPGLFERHLPPLPGRPPALSSASEPLASEASASPPSHSPLTANTSPLAVLTKPSSSGTSPQAVWQKAW